MELDVTGETTVKQLLDANQDRLGGVITFIDKGEVLVTVNKKIGALTSVVRDGDTVKFLPHRRIPALRARAGTTPDHRSRHSSLVKRISQENVSA